MSDWKSPFIVFAADEDSPLPIEDTVFCDRATDLLARAHETGEKREFDSVSYDHLLFLDRFLPAYKLPESQSLAQIGNADDGEIRFLTSAQREVFLGVLEEFERRFLADPGIAAEVARREDDRTFVHVQEAIGKTPPGFDAAFWDGKRRESAERYRAARAAEPIDGARMLGLWNANEGRGYLPPDYPEAARALFSERPATLLSSAFQTFGYLKAMRRWCEEAEGRAIMEIIW
ncbi:MAG: hypothetical protein ACK5MQ_08200 [Pikeienuella sp.]